MINTKVRARVHYLDNLRAYIMWLGVVIHVAMLQMVSQTPQQLRESALSEWADLLVFSIHSFRMPLFFVLSGFFVAAILARKGLKQTIKLRLLRIGIPLIIFGPIVSYALHYIIIEYTEVMRASVAGKEPDTVQEYQFNFGHLWFLYYLLICHIILLPIFYTLTANYSSYLKQLQYRLSHPASIVLYATLIAYIDSYFDRGMIPAEGGLTPNTLQLMHYVPYFLYGFLLYKYRNLWLNHYQRCWGRYTVAGFVMMMLTMIVVEPLLKSPGTQVDNFAVALCYGLWGWFWSFALFGFFKQFSSRYIIWLRYLSESAYWVYIVHVPIVLLISFLMYDYQYPFYIKMVLNIVLTSLLSLFSYHILVRYTWLGWLLNGRRRVFKFRKEQVVALLD